MIDHLLDVLDGQAAYEWAPVRDRGLDLLDTIRTAIELDSDPVAYRGDDRTRRWGQGPVTIAVPVPTPSGAQGLLNEP